MAKGNKPTKNDKKNRKPKKPKVAANAGTPF